MIKRYYITGVQMLLLKSYILLDKKKELLELWDEIKTKQYKRKFNFKFVFERDKDKMFKKVSKNE